MAGLPFLVPPPPSLCVRLEKNTPQQGEELLTNSIVDAGTQNVSISAHSDTEGLGLKNHEHTRTVTCPDHTSPRGHAHPLSGTLTPPWAETQTWGRVH